MARKLHYLFLVLLHSSLFLTIHSHANTSALTACLDSSGVKNFTVSSTLAYSHLLNFSIRNLRFAGAGVTKPTALILPRSVDDLRSSVICLRAAYLAIRVRSGGHSYEGLSYTADDGVPFAIVDLMNLNRVRVDPGSPFTWAESGASLGEIYYAVAASNRTLAFSAGSCATVGSGGHIAGGGFGLLSRKYGVAADNVVDAILVDSTGRVLNRDSMGEDVFWAIRGGGGGSWGVVYSWQLRLVPVPERVTVCTPTRSGSTGSVAELLHRWQFVAPNLPEEFYLSVYIAGSGGGNVSASFTGFFLASRKAVVSSLSQRFPELALAESGCREVSWIESVVQVAGLDSVSELTSRESSSPEFFKAKSDYVRTPIDMAGMITTLDYLSRKQEAYIILDPYGGAMGRVKSDRIPFPHRAGNLYGIQYMVHWTVEEDTAREKHVAWLRDFYEYMSRHVSKNPRAAFVNYLDLDLGMVEWSRGEGPTDAVSKARVYGERYFLGNYERLVKAKTIIDTENVFNNPQSIPPLNK